jgi:hypothetical protein|tara:strand:- start:160 stop:573 length:414 start_codon:yes stop_codon:yes gene_type:complete
MDYFIKRFEQLITFDKTRIGKFIEFFQYSFIFTIMAAYAAHYTNEYLLFDADNSYSLLKMMIILSIELAILTIIVFYLRKITLIIPSISAYIFNHFEPYTTLELTIWTVLVFVFIGNIDKLNDKLTLIKKKMLQNKK